MGFQLVIAEGKEAGREFVFDQASVVIGRTADCDVILYEGGVSRTHARIFTENEAFFIEDLESSNGTRVNGQPVTRQPLNEGDSITIGPVTFSFKPIDLDPTLPPEGAPAEGEGEGEGQHTRIVSVSELQRSRNKAVAMLPKGTSRTDFVEFGQRGTMQMPVLKGPRPSVPQAPRPSASRRALAERPTDLPEGVEVSGGGRPTLTRPSKERPALTAADRARLRRDGLLGAAKLYWAEASPHKRVLTAAVLAVVTLAGFGGLVAALVPEGKAPVVEPTMLTGEPLMASFGHGDGVTFERRDEKVFDFAVKSPVQVMVVLHYQSKDINSKDEVAVAVNGTEVGFLPPDTLDVDERTAELLIPSSIIHRNEPNTVVFDNLKNPPERDSWRIWNLWIEVAVLPEKDEVGLIAEAEDKFKKGQQKWEQRDIGASNRWDAYKYFREAWLFLEAVPQTKRPATYLLAREKMREARTELDLKCRNLLLDARTAYNLNQFDRARFALDHVVDFFPTKAHPCQSRAEYDREFYSR